MNSLDLFPILPTIADRSFACFFFAAYDFFSWSHGPVYPYQGTKDHTKMYLSRSHVDNYIVSIIVQHAV